VTRERTGYALATLVVLILEILIAAYVHDSFVRPHLGDSIAVVLVYLALRTTTRLPVRPAAIIALLIACLIEIGQWFDILGRTGLDRFPVARIVLGTGFDPTDFLAYAGGAAFVMLVEAARFRKVSA